MKKKPLSVRIAIILVAAGVYAAGIFGTPLEGLSTEGFRALCTLIAAVILWVSEVIPVLITALMILPGLTYAGAMTTQQFFSSAASSAVFFMLAGFGIGAALLKTNFATVIMRFILKWANGSSKRIISGILILTAVVSLIVADSAAVIAVLGLSTASFKCIGDPAPGTSRLAKGIMIAVPWGSMCGGIAMPCSNGINAILMDLLVSQTGTAITFLEWSVVGIPCSIIMTLFGAWWLPRCCDPEPLTEEQKRNFEETYCKDVRFNAQDWKFVIIVATMLVLWIASNWIAALDVARVALLGVGAMFLPGIELIDGDDYMKSMAPMGLVMLLSVMPIASAINITGAGAWIADLLFDGAAGWSKPLLLFMMAFGALILHLFVPAGNSCATLCGVLLFSTALSTGITGPAICVILGMQCGNAFMTAYEGIYSFTFGYGHYTFGDVFKFGLPLAAMQLLLSVTVVPLFAGFIG